MKTMAALGGLALSTVLASADLPRAQEPPGTKAPRTGENSFTEGQAKAWLEDAGYTHVAGLVLGSDGVWRASARLKGVPALVRLDYQGNITEH